MNTSDRAGLLTRLRIHSRHHTARMLLILLSVAVMAAFPAASFPASGRHEASASVQEVRPNVLFIITDDQRAADLDLMPKTARWLSRQGTTYTHAYATTPVCCPARASIMTGRYAHNTGVLTNATGLALDHSTTLAHYLQRAGYSTAMFGKFLNAWPIEKPPPHFDEWATLKGSGSGYVNGTWNVQGQIGTLEVYATHYMGERAAQFIDSHTAPWFMYLAVPSPHAPFTAEEKYQDAPVPTWDGNPAVFEVDRSDKPPYVRRKELSYTTGADVRIRQLRTLMSVDDMVDTVMSALEASDQLDNTLVVFVSDNGYLWGDHGLMGKTYPYVHSVRVPLITRWPGHIAAGNIDRGLVANVDIAPTVMEAAGIQPLTSMDGRSLLSSYRRRRLLTEYWKQEGRKTPTWASLLTKKGHYVEYYDKSGDNTFREYYDLNNDPWELRNLRRPPHTRWVYRLARARVCSGRACP